MHIDGQSENVQWQTRELVRYKKLWLTQCTYFMQKGVLRRILVFTETDMLGEFEKRKKIGRFPGNIELILVDELPSEIRKSLESSRKRASKEVSKVRMISRLRVGLTSDSDL